MNLVCVLVVGFDLEGFMDLGFRELLTKRVRVQNWQGFDKFLWTI